MENYVIRFRFKSPVHFGDSNQDPDITSSDFLLQNDSLFSALMNEAVRIYGQDGANEFYNKNKNISFSSMMPYRDDVFYIPKPIFFTESEKTNETNNYGKLLKKLKYIPVSYLSEYLEKSRNSDLPVEELVKKQNSFGIMSTEVKVNISRDSSKDNMPYYVGTFTFEKNCGTYIVMKCENSELDYIKILLNSLSVTGIGGKRSSGYGKFEYEIIEVKTSNNPDIKAYEHLLSCKAERYMTLSICLPTDDCDDSFCTDAYYTLVRRSGFIDSVTYNSSLMKKKDVYVFGVGSTFTHVFEGQIKNVGSDFGKHPVYKHLKPIFIGVKSI